MDVWTLPGAGGRGLLLEPLHGLAESVLERYLRLPAERVGGVGDVEDAALLFAGLALGVDLVHTGLGDRVERTEELVHARLAPRADVHDVRALGVQAGEDGTDDVTDVDVVARLLAV